MRSLAARIKPATGFSRLVHWLLVAVLPLLVFVTVRLSFVPLAYAVVLLSKWRMLAVRPRHWPANIRANSIDMLVGVSIVTFIAQAPTQAWQLAWTVFYAIWLIIIKPRATVFWNSIQAGIGQLTALGALYVLWAQWDEPTLLSLVVLSWLICYLAARHFFSSFDEHLGSLMAHIWGYFGAALTWVLGHWLLYYGFLSQPTLILGVLATGLAALYYLEDSDKLSTFVRREILLIMSAVILVVIIFSDWGDKAV